MPKEPKSAFMFCWFSILTALVHDPVDIYCPLSIISPFSAKKFISHKAELKGLFSTFLVFPFATISLFISRNTGWSSKSTLSIGKISLLLIQKSEAPLVDIKLFIPILSIECVNLKSTISIEHTIPSNK